jgi:hypothetical protein
MRLDAVGMLDLMEGAKTLRKYIGTKMSLVWVARSTEKNEPVGLSTRAVPGSRIVTVIGSWLRLPE